MSKDNWKCKWFGHKWIPVYIRKKGEKGYRFIACYCDRCRYGHDDIINFVMPRMPIINTYSEEYF